MPAFLAYGLRIQSGIPLPELAEATPGPADFSLEMAEPDPAPAGGEAPGGWILLADDGAGRPWLSLARRPGGYRLRFRDLADFDVPSSADRARCIPGGGVPAATLRHLFLDHVLPRLLGHRGRLVLHASCVETGRGAIAFAGRTGSGKSTLAAALCARGFPLVADDAVVVEPGDGGPLAVPAYAGVRLWPDSPSRTGAAGTPSPVAHYTGKLRLASGDLRGRAAAGPARLHRVHLLEGPPAGAGDLRIEALPLREALLGLLGNSFLLDPEDPGRIGRHFEALTPPPVLRAVRRLRHPHDPALLEEVLDRVLAEAEAP